MMSTIKHIIAGECHTLRTTSHSLTIRSWSMCYRIDWRPRRTQIGMTSVVKTLVITRAWLWFSWIREGQSRFWYTIISRNQAPAIPANFTMQEDHAKVCPCTPLCERNIYRATVSQAEISKAMVKSIAVRYAPSLYYKSANRLEDYVIMHITNASWTSRLYELSNMYNEPREDILKLMTKTVRIADRQKSELEQNACFSMTLETLSETLRQFVAWEKSSFFLDYSLTLYSENFISRMANDMARNLGNIENFTRRYIEQLQQINDSSRVLISCNVTDGYTFHRDVQNIISDVKASIATFQNQYQILARDVRTHDLMSSYKYPVDGTKEDYIRWAREWICVVSFGHGHRSWRLKQNFELRFTTEIICICQNLDWLH